MPLFTWCEIQGLFHDFPGPFQADLYRSQSTKTWTLHRFFSKQTSLFSFTYSNWPILTMKKTNNRSLWTKIRPCKVAVFVLQHCCIKNILTNSTFLLLVFWKWKKKFFCQFQDFQGPQPKFKDFPGPGNCFPQF